LPASVSRHQERFRAPRPPPSASAADHPGADDRRILRLPAELYSYQRRLIAHNAREYVVVSATQIGKTTACACWLLAQLWDNPGTRGWWAAPTYWQADIGMDTLTGLLESAGLRQGIDFRRRGASGRAAIFLPNGSVIEFRSWDKPKNLGGRAVHFMVVDEAGQLTKDAKTRLEARLSATLGPVRYIGNPEVTGSEFWKICQDAIEAEADPKSNVIDGRARFAFQRWTWQHRHRELERLAPAAAADYQRWIDQKFRENPDEAKRLYGAEWAVPERAIFGDIIDLIFGTADAPTVALSQDPHPGHAYLVGWDIGIEQDWTVGIPLCLDCWTVTDTMRFRPGDSTGMEKIIADYSRHWNTAAAVIETNGPGKPKFDDTIRAYTGGQVQRWWTDNSSKRNAVFALIEQARSETGPLKIADLPILKGEMQVFQSMQNPKTGSWSFSAPAGVKDDCVMGLVIAIGAATSGAAAYLALMKRQRLEREKAKGAAA